MGQVSGGARRRVVLLAVLNCVLAGVALAVPAGAFATLSWSAPMVTDTAGTGLPLSAVACPTAASCTALTAEGGAVSFSPTAPGPSTPAPIDSSEPTAATCISATTCVSVDLTGGETTFNPAAPASGTTVTIDSGNALTGVACPAATSCVGVDTAGHEITFTPGATTTVGDVVGKVDSTANAILTAVSCFAAPSAQQSDCVAVDDAGLESTFNSQTGQSTGQSTIDFESSGAGSSNALTALVCPSGSQCLAFDGNGAQIEFDPSNFTGTTRNIIDPGNSIIAAACPSASQCTVLDTAGGEVTLVPLGSTSPAPSNQPPRQSLDPTQSLTALVCPQGTVCVAINADGQAITFTPDPGGHGAVASPVLVDAVNAYSTVACAAADQCTAADRQGDVVSFDPGTGIEIADGSVDPGAIVVYGMSCAALTQCTLVDQNGNAVSFNPQAPSTHSSAQLVKSHPLLAVACPAVSQCTAVDDDQDEITFNPSDTAAATYALLGTAAGTPITGVACPTVAQCTAVDGTGDAVTFNPVSPGKPAPRAVLAADAVAVSCPATTECVALSDTGQRATFSPQNPAAVTTAGVDASQPGSLACSTATFCTEIDAAGDVVEFDPHGGGATLSQEVAAAGSLTGLACAAPVLCVASDSTGHIEVGTGQLPSLPSSTARPRITGSALQGDRLTGSIGSWTNAATGYLAEWERCSSRGAACRPIAGATAQRYLLTAADAGHRLRLSESASNPSGFGASVESAFTRVIRGLPTLARPMLTMSRKRSATLTVTADAGVDAAPLHTLTLTLPSGVGFRAARARPARHHPAGIGVVLTTGITIAVAGRRARFRVELIRHHLQIALRRPAAKLRLTLRTPQLTVSAALARRLTHRIRSRLVLAVTLTAPRQQSQRATIAWRAL